MAPVNDAVVLMYNLKVEPDAVPVFRVRQDILIMSPTAKVLAGINWLALICSDATPVMDVPSVVLL